MKRLERDFFTVDGLTLAKSLLGKTMVHRTHYGEVKGVITETEAYMGEGDKASHTYGGKRTDRTEPMYHIGGTSYVYLIYGMYSCMNVAASTDGIPQAVLIRAAEPADETSREIMLRLRREKQGGKGLRAGAEKNILKHLADGPGKLCIAMDISKKDNRIDMVTDDTFYWTEGIEVEPRDILAGKRINIDYAEEDRERLWRFTLINPS